MKNFALLIMLLVGTVLDAQVGEVIWEENFNDLDNWNIETGNGSWGWGNGELEYYNTDNVEVAEIPGDTGNMGLHITARQETGSWIVDQWGNPLNYTSGKVTTKAKVAIQYGMLETRVSIPDINLGGWPAVWLLGTANYTWPYNGELDMMEMGSAQAFRDLHDEHNGGNGLNNSNVNQVVGANAIFYSDDAVTPENPSGAASISWDPDDETCRPYYNYTNPLVERFMTYRMYWDPDSIRFTVIDEGEEYDLYTDPFPIDSVSHEFTQPFYLIANLAIGGAYTDAYNLGDPGSGAPVSMPFPADMYVDYIKVFEWNGQGAVNLGPPYPESGSFGIFTDNTETNGRLEAGVSAEIYVWAGTLTDGSIEPYEGDNGISWQTTSAGWFGAGIMSVQPLNMTNFGDGHLKFMINIPANVSFKIGIIDTWGNQNYVDFPANETVYGLVRNGQWGQASVPIIDIRGESIDLRMLNYEFVILEENGSACEFGIDDIYWDGGGVPNPPIANAGPDQIIDDIDGNNLETVTLDGSASSDHNGSIENFSWTVGDTLLATGETVDVELELGLHEILLTVTDNEGNSANDLVQITILNNFPPIANAGEDQTVIDLNGDGSETVALDGSESSDSDGNIVSYSWIENGNELANTVSPTLNLGIGVHAITLTVTDNEGGVGIDALTIRVNNNLPVAAPAIYYAGGPVTIDSNIESVWFNTPEMEINNVTVGTRTPDFHAQWKAMYDDTNLYILVEINDDSIINDSNGEWYKDDCVEVFIDADNSSDATYDGVNDFQLGFRWDDPVIQIGNNSVNNITGISYLLYATADGYNLEASILWSTLGVSPTAGSIIGFDVAVDDDDNGGDRECTLASIFTSDNAWHNPSVFGNVPLVFTTGSGDDKLMSIPTDFSLDQNYPNPFNPKTIINYRLPESAEISLIIYDIKGNIVKTIESGRLVAGRYTYVWNGQDNTDQPVSTGLYFTKIQADSYSRTIKMIFLK